MAHFLVRFHLNFSIATRLATVAPSCPAGSWSDATMGQPTTLVAHSTPPQQHRPNKRMWPPFFVTPGRGTKPYGAVHSEGHTWLAQLGELLVGAAVVGCALTRRPERLGGRHAGMYIERHSPIRDFSPPLQWLETGCGGEMPHGATERGVKEVARRACDVIEGGGALCLTANEK